MFKTPLKNLMSEDGIDSVAVGVWSAGLVYFGVVAAQQAFNAAATGDVGTAVLFSGCALGAGAFAAAVGKIAVDLGKEAWRATKEHLNKTSGEGLPRVR